MKGIKFDDEEFVISNLSIFKVDLTKLSKLEKKPDKPEIVPLIPSGERIMVPFKEQSIKFFLNLILKFSLTKIGQNL